MALKHHTDYKLILVLVRISRSINVQQYPFFENSLAIISVAVQYQI